MGVPCMPACSILLHTQASDTSLLTACALQFVSAPLHGPSIEKIHWSPTTLAWCPAMLHLQRHACAGMTPDLPKPAPCSPHTLMLLPAATGSQLNPRCVLRGLSMIVNHGHSTTMHAHSSAPGVS